MPPPPAGDVVWGHLWSSCPGVLLASSGWAQGCHSTHNAQDTIPLKIVCPECRQCGGPQIPGGGRQRSHAAGLLTRIRVQTLWESAGRSDGGAGCHSLASCPEVPPRVCRAGSCPTYWRWVPTGPEQSVPPGLSLQGFPAIPLRARFMALFWAVLKIQVWDLRVQPPARCPALGDTRLAI